MNDNLGGYRKIELLSAGRIEGMNISDTVTALPADGARWIDIPFQRHTAKIEISPEKTDAGMIYHADIELHIPHQYLTAELREDIRQFSASGAIIRYTTCLGETFIAGTADYPLQPTVQDLHPGSASGLSALKLVLSGKSVYPQLPASLQSF
ncbi:MAG: hypothetical protein LBI65_01785 [Candidatus Symbiothrix sp.]|jgi:hypothetical protein|nr:hypothetical protein [Candidatus Symbiothrix sp.]